LAGISGKETTIYGLQENFLSATFTQHMTLLETNSLIAFNQTPSGVQNIVQALNYPMELPKDARPPLVPAATTANVSYTDLYQTVVPILIGTGTLGRTGLSGASYLNSNVDDSAKIGSFGVGGAIGNSPLFNATPRHH
jgi:hypothetical protein